MKYLITILTAVSALCVCSLARSEAPPAPSERSATAAEQSVQPASGSFEINHHYDLSAFAVLDALAANVWKQTIFAIALALAACAYLPKKYRSFGAFLRYLKDLSRDSLWRFEQRLKLLRIRIVCALQSLFGYQIAINSALALSPRQEALVEAIVRQIEDPQGADLAINAPGVYRSGEVTEWDRSGFVNAPLATNASQFAGNNPHEYLSQYAVRYQDPHQQTLDTFTDLLAPPVMSNNSRFVEYAVYGFTDAFLSLDNTVDDIRGIGADYATLRNPTKSLVTQRMNERGLAVEVDEMEEILPGDTNEWQQTKIAWLIGIGARTRLRRAVAMFVAMATSSSKTWMAGSGADPDQDVMDELDNLPIRPNNVLYGTGAWSKRSRTFRGQATAGAFGGVRTAGLAAGVAGNALAAARDTADELAGIFGVDNVRISRHRTATGASTIGDIIGSLVFLFISQASPSRFDFTNCKTFRAPALSPQGAPIGQRAVYVRQIGDRRWRIAVSFGSELVAATSAIGAEVITVS